MAEIIGGGEPVNDAERAVIRHLRDHGPATGWCCTTSSCGCGTTASTRSTCWSSPSIAVTLIDVKGTHGRIEVAGGRWYPANRAAVPVAGGEAARPCPGAQGAT